jgi:hypothetical protein
MTPFLTSLAVVTMVAAPAPDSAPGPLVLGRGSVARSEVVVVGRDLVLRGDARSHVAVLQGSATIAGAVDGDVIVLSGDVRVDREGRVGGDLFVLGGDVEVAPGGQLGGRVVSFASISSVWLTLVEGPSLGLPSFSPVVLGAKLALIAAWLALLLLLFGSSPLRIMSTSEEIAREPFRSFFVGLVGVLALVLTSVLFSALAVAMVGLPLLGLVAMFALFLKLWGMIAVFHALGSWISRVVLRRRFLPLTEATLGLLLLGGLKFVPYVGVWVWTAATLIAVGATLTTKFGQREPWFPVLEAPGTVP